MRFRVQAVREEPLDRIAAINARRQADGVQDQQGDRLTGGALVAVGRRHVANASDDAIRPQVQVYCSGSRMDSLCIR